MDFEKYGFQFSVDQGGYVFEDQDAFPFSIQSKDDFLTLFSEELKVSEGRIPATNQSLALLLKAFGVKREKA